MFATLRRVADQFLGRGHAAITVPVMDGKLLPNRVLDQAELVAELPDIDDLAGDGRTLWASAGPVLWRLEEATLVEVRRFDADISALAIQASGRLALALAGREILVFDADPTGATPVARLTEMAGQPLHCVNALAFDAQGRLLLSDGSTRHAPPQWSHDLMALGQSGRVGRWDIGADKTELIAHNLAYAFGVLASTGDSVLFSESWRHQVLRAGAAQPMVAELPGYPSRMTPAAGGGFWLSCFVCRTQLVEFVLREPAYRQRMVAEIDPRYWIAPALSSGQSFLEPIQGARVKNMGVMKPWAPPRSYGLVLRVGEDGRILRSLHSQVDGRHHGITALVEHGGALYAASKGSGRLLRVALNETAKEPS